MNKEEDKNMKKLIAWTMIGSNFRKLKDDKVKGQDKNGTR